MSSILNCEQLFLLEVVVEEMVIEKFENQKGLHTELKFHGLPCFEVSQKPGEGKSCLFCMDPLTFAEAMQGEPLVFSVWWTPEENNLPNVIAQAWVPFPDAMIDVVRSAADKAPENPTEEKIKKIYKLKNQVQEFMGEVCLIIRLTCYGRTILTGFQMTMMSKFKFETIEKEKEPACEMCPSKRKYVKPPLPKMLDEACQTEPEETPEEIPRNPAAKIRKRTNESKEKETMKHFADSQCGSKYAGPKICHGSAGSVISNETLKVIKKPKRIKSSQFVKGINKISYPSHKCSQLGHQKIPENHGWAWSSKVPIGPKKFRTWCPGKIAPIVLSRLEEMRAIRSLPPLNDTFCTKDTIASRKLIKKNPTLHYHSLPRSNQIIFWPNDKLKRPLKWSIIRPSNPDESDSTDSEFELEFDIPPQPPVIKLHKQTQYHLQDCPLPPPLPPSIISASQQHQPKKNIK